jgi:NAD(P)H-hydrate epimerase
MKLLTNQQIREIDNYTILNEPIPSIDLMERAANQLAGFIIEHFSNTIEITLIAGPGNNGGDAAALARILADINYSVELIMADFGSSLSEDCQINFDRIKKGKKVPVHHWTENSEPPVISKEKLIVEGIFGSGLTRPVKGFPGKIIQHINNLPNTVFSIDIPSGLFSEDNTNNDGEIIKADFTVSFEFPKLAFLLPENEIYVGEWHTRSIGLHPQAIDDAKTPYYLTTDKNLPTLKKRRKFAHKGDFGHALLVAGSFGKTGAAVLAAKGCLRSGSGLLSIHIPQSSYAIMQSCVPEAMLVIDETEQIYCQKNELEKFSVIGIGPGIGQKKSMQEALLLLIKNATSPMVLDADALNIISQNKDWLELLPEQSIITPHPKEFERLTGKHQSHYERIECGRSLAKSHRINIVLKGAYTAVISSSGEVFFNTTGNPAMAKGGSGDVLTGIILGLLSSGYAPYNAARIGVYVHGLAADIALESQSIESLIATDIIKHLGEAYNNIRKSK